LNTEQHNKFIEQLAPGLGIKVLGVLLLFFALALTASVFYTIGGEKQIMQQQLEREGNSLAQASSIFATESLLIEDYPVLNTYTDGLVINYPDLIHILIKRKDGKTVASSIRKSKVHADNVKHYYSNVAVGDDLIGQIEIAISTINSDAFILDHLKTMIVQSVLIFLTLAVALFVFFRRKITDPIHRLAYQARFLSEGDLAHPIEVGEKGELHQLASVLNNMRLSLKKSYDEITTQNRLLDQRVAERTTELSSMNSKLMETHAQLLQAEKMAAIGVLSAGVAHEINNPIGFVSSNISMLSGWYQELINLIESYESEMMVDSSLMAMANHYKKERDFDYIKDEMPVLLKETLDGLSRVSAIVADLKGFSHADEMIWEITDVHECIKSSLNIANNEIKYKAEVKLNFEEIPLVECIPSQIAQVIMNVIVNAAQSIEEKGTITIKTKEYDSWVCISISDTGTGISQENQNRMTEPFFTTKPVGKGTGLGLSVSYDIVKAHHGRIDVESQLGKGSIFYIWLPVKQPDD